jgi:hypothetical protein
MLSLTIRASSGDKFGVDSIDPSITISQLKGKLVEQSKVISASQDLA